MLSPLTSEGSAYPNGAQVSDGQGRAECLAATPAGRLFRRLFQRKSHFDCPVQFLNLRSTQRSDEARQLHLAEANEVVAQDRAFMFQAFVDTDCDLG